MCPSGVSGHSEITDTPLTRQWRISRSVMAGVPEKPPAFPKLVRAVLQKARISHRTDLAFVALRDPEPHAGINSWCFRESPSSLRQTGPSCPRPSPRSNFTSLAPRV